MTRTAARRASARSVSSGWARLAEPASAESTRVISRAYGLDASTRACARTIRAPAISSWAEKIFFVDWVERIRRRSARRDAAMSGAPLHLDALLAALGLVHGLGLGLLDLQGLAAGGLVLAVEVLHGLLQGGDGVVTQGLGLADLVEDALVVTGQEVQELRLEPAHLG